MAATRQPFPRRQALDRQLFLLYRDIEGGRRSDTVLANQLAGEWCARLHGLTGVFPPENVSKALEMVERCCMPLTDPAS